MKKFLSKYWKRILILIASIFIIINIVSKCVAPHVLVDEFGVYGPDVESAVKSGEIINATDIVDKAQDSSPFPEDVTRLILVFIVGIVGALVIGEITTKKSSGGKKK